MHRSYYLLVPYILIILISGCAQREVASESHSDVVIDNVPFVKQKDKFCGPAAMASVMQFYGQNIDQNTIAEVIYTPQLNGALISDMENFAKDNGYSVISTNGNFEVLKSYLDNKHPVILLVDKGKWKVSVPHYYVAYGYNDEKETVILHTGFNRGEEMSIEKLNQEWIKMNRLMLVLTK